MSRASGNSLAWGFLVRPCVLALGLSQPASCLFLPLWQEDRGRDPHGQRHPGVGLRLSHLCLGAAGHSCLQKAWFGSVVSQLLPPPVPAGSQPSSLAGLVCQGVWGIDPLSPHCH